MRTLPKRTAVFAALFLLAGILNGLAANAEELPEAPAFHACIEYSFQGYAAKGSFTEIPHDISLIQPLYSLDGETYQACGEPWDLHWLGMDDAGAQAKLQNQICLYPSQEPLKSYLDKKLDRFFLKLHLVLKSGTAYETQAALIDRGSPQPIPEGLCPNAKFASSLAAYEMRPFCCYGRYQLTVCADASSEDVTSCLPDTLPVEIQLEKDRQYVTGGIVDCRVTWKPLLLPRLTAGESVTIGDAAEEIVIPEGTLLNTPTGIFQLDEPLKLYDQYGFTDEVRLTLNVIAEDENPTGVLSAENAGLEMAFHLKPTGAASIRAYTLSKGETEWTEIPGLSLLNAVNAQPSTAGSGYTLVLDNTREPYQSYLAAEKAEETPEPFLVGLKIEGGAYDGRQLILAWPDTYELPLALPKLSGSGGNEVNAGTDNKNDSTPEGQRPDLPQHSKDNPDAKEPPADPVQNHEGAPPVNTPRHKKTLSNTAGGFKNNALTAVSDAKNDTQTAVSDAKNDTQTAMDADSNDNVWTERTAVQEPQPAQTAVSTVTSSVQDENTDAAEASSLQKMPDRGAADNGRGTFLPLTAAATAGIGIGITAAVHKITAGRKLSRVLNILQKFHYKCRTLARR